MSQDSDYFDFVQKHSRPIVGEEPHRIGLMLFDPVPPSSGVPRWVLEQLSEGDLVSMRREERPNSNRPDFSLWTLSGHYLGRVPDNLRGLFEAYLLEGFQLEVAVFVPMPDWPPEVAVQLELSALFWPGNDPIPTSPSEQAGYPPGWKVYDRPWPDDE